MSATIAFQSDALLVISELQRICPGVRRWRERSELVWIVNVLPNKIAPYIANQMDAAVTVMTDTFALSTTHD